MINSIGKFVNFAKIAPVPAPKTMLLIIILENLGINAQLQWGQLKKSFLAFFLIQLKDIFFPHDGQSLENKLFLL